MIDEADVFLEARNSTEIARNALGKLIVESFVMILFLLDAFKIIALVLF